MSQSIRDMQGSLRFDTLHWVNDELRQLLVDIQRELESVSRAQDPSDVADVIDSVEQLSGTLSLIEINGGALLAKEMSAVLQAMQSHTIEKIDYALELLLSSVIRIEDYLDYLSNGHQDLPALLLPSINDLREVRQVEVMSDKVIFMPDFKSALDTIELHSLDNEDIQIIARKGRIAYQTALRDLIKDHHLPAAYERMQALLHDLYKASSQRLSANMWWIAEALIDVIDEFKAEHKQPLFMLLGKIDRLIKVLIDQGEHGLQKAISFELIKNMLYYLAKSQLDTARVNKAKDIFSLEDYLIKDLRDNESNWLGSPNKQLIDSVSKALGEDVNAIKDVIELYSHSDRNNLQSLSQASDVMQKVSDTLIMLGLSATKDSIQAEKETLDQHIADNQALSDELLMSIAGVLLTIEEDIQAYSENRSTLSDTQAQVANDSNDDTSVIAENHKVVATVANEALRELAWVKDIYLDYLNADNSTEVLGRVPKVLGTVAGAMFINPLSGIVTALNELKDYVENILIHKAHQPSDKEQNIFAEVITNIECFLEATMENRLDAELFIDASNLALDELASVSPSVVETSASHNLNAITDDLENLVSDMQMTPAVMDSQDEAIISVEIDDNDAEIVTDIDVLSPEPLSAATIEDSTALDEKLDAATQPEAHATDSITAAYKALAIIGADADDEIKEIFIEEAEEEAAKLNDMVPRWHADDDNQLINTIRRSFHTLKGSGRIIGAQLIGEFAWKFENLLNRMIEGSIKLDSETRLAIEQAVGVLPMLIEQIRHNDTSPRQDVFDLMLRAENLSALKTQETNATETFADEASIEISAATPIDDDMFDRDESANAESESVAAGLVASAETDELSAAMLALDAADSFLEKPAASSTETLDDSNSLSVDEAEVMNAGELLLNELEDSEKDLEQLIQFDEAASPETSPTLHNDAPVHDLNNASVDDAELSVDVSQQAATTVTNNASAVAEPLNAETEDVDIELIKIFSEEVSTHLSVIDKFIQQSEAASIALHGDEGLYRALHTLHGSAKTSEYFSQIAQLSENLELLFNGFKTLGIAWESNDLALLKSGLHFIQNNLAALAEGQLYYQDKENVIQRAVIRYAEIKAKLTAQYRILSDTQVHEIDEELVEIFLEEGDELLDLLERAVHHAVSENAIESQLPEILRVLHTLKGSARMANLSPIGDLSHTLESVFVEIAEDKLAFNDNVKATVQRSTDNLSNMVHLLKGNQAPADAFALIEELKAIIENKDITQAQSSAQPVSEKIDIVAPDENILADSSNNSVDQTTQTSTPNAPPPLSTASREHAATKQLDIASENKQPVLVDEKARQDEANLIAGRQDVVRVHAERLDNLVNFAGEVNIFQSRLGKYINDLATNLVDVDSTLDRLRGQLRNMELETEAQISSRMEREREDPNIEFDPLEMDRYSNMQHLTRAISESAEDLSNIRSSIGDLIRESESTVMQQSRVTTELQDGLIKTQMVSFEGLISRLRRLVRQTSQQLHKKVEISIKGFETEIDRSVQVALISSLEHILRNAIFHGIEMPYERIRHGKPETGRITMEVRRDGSYIVIQISDDGYGIDPNKVREKAINLGLIKEDQYLEQKDVLQLVLLSGFSTASEVSQIAGRGVGLDVVDNQIKDLGGTLNISSTPGSGTTFSLRLPQTLSISNGLMVDINQQPYVILLSAISGIATVSGEMVQQHINGEFNAYEYDNEDYPVHYLGSLFNQPVPDKLKDKNLQVSLVLVQGAGQKVALIVDQMMGKRELVVKPVGAQLSTMRGVSGATILSDGAVSFIIDPIELLQQRYAGRLESTASIQAVSVVEPVTESIKLKQKIMIVDDSITIRKVSQRLLERKGYEVYLAKDGVDAIEQLTQVSPDLFLLDIEMPRMDGFELASHIRSTDKTRHLPIIMITSRTGAKHRERAEALAVNCYLGKPFQEAELLKEIDNLLGEN